MKRPAQLVVAFAVFVVFIVLIAGCEEPSLSNIKKHRLIASENRQLKKQLEQRDREIEKLKRISEGRPPENIENLLNLASMQIAEENTRLYAENEKLKAQVQQLEKELKELKRRAGP